MADTLELFLTAPTLQEARTAIEQCTGLVGEPGGPGQIDFPQPGFYGRLGEHSFLDDGDLDYSSFRYVLTAKNYGEPETRSPEDSDTVRWFRSLFDCLQGRADGRLLLSYNLEYALARFDPGAPDGL